jgi:hypothetical protein
MTQLKRTDSTHYIVNALLLNLVVLTNHQSCLSLKEHDHLFALSCIASSQSSIAPPTHAHCGPVLFQGSGQKLTEA